MFGLCLSLQCKKISLIYQITHALFTKCVKIKREQKGRHVYQCSTRTSIVLRIIILKAILVICAFLQGIQYLSACILVASLYCSHHFCTSKII